MSKPMVEKYEQLLAQDPTSTVFVELARAYIDRGDNERAIATCQQGVTHHPNSVVGRVLWGKALINAGKAADAMKQFDLAVNIDRENPHAYNLIGEALLRKGLYRSALPILRRAVALQPNDHRIAQWFEQTKQALSGGPAPILGDGPLVQDKPAAAAIAQSDDPFAAFAPAKTDPDAQPTVLMPAHTAATVDRSRPPVPTAELPAVVPQNHQDERRTQELPLINATMDAPDPFASFGSSSDPDTVRGLTSTFDALGSSGAFTGNGPISPQVDNEPSVVVQGVALEDSQPNPMPSGPRAGGPPVLEAVAPPVAAPPPPAGLLEDVVSTQSEMPTSEFQMPGMIQTPLHTAGTAPRSSGGLLDDIPDEMEPPSAVVAPSVSFNTQATEAIAREYERELRAKLEVTKQKKTFFQAHGLKIAVIAVLVVLVGGLGGSFVYTRVKNQGETLDTSIAKGLSSVNADTKEQYGAAVKALEQAVKMDDSNTEAAALNGYARAMLFAENGGTAADRDAAIAAFAQPTVRNARPDLALVVDFLTADDASRGAARQQLLGSSLEKAAVQAQAGRMFLADKKYDDALARLKKATELDPRNTRALVALGDYYLAFEDWDSALEMLSRAESLSKFHPARVIGHAEARLELGRELPEALNDLEGLPSSAEIPEALKGRYALMLGRAQSANGKHDEALKTLTDAQPKHADLALQYAMALGDAQRSAGQMAAAQKSFEDALKLAPKSESAKEGLGRVLLARSREKELTDRLRADKDARKVALLRGIAFYRLGDTKKARAELQATQSNGKYPAEAAVYLALLDASEEGSGDKAVEALEKFAGSLKKNKATVQVALARVYMQKGALDKARTQLEDAAKDPQDYEGNALLGELLLKAGVPPDVAIEPLQRAVERNGSHAPSRHLLTRVLLQLGKVPEAVKQIEAWTLDNPSLELVWRDAALVYLQAGRIKDSVNAMSKVSDKVDDVEWWRTKAQIEFARADGRAAMAALEKANKLNPKDAETFCEIGNAFVRQGNNDTAGAAYGAATREDPKSICGLGGPLFAKPVKGSKSKELINGLVSRSTNAWEKGSLLATLARVQLLDNDAAGARESVEEALKEAPFHPAAWFANGEVFKREKNDAKAIEAYGKAAEFDGSWSQVRMAYADALAKQGGGALPQAITQYEAVLVIDQNEGDLARVKKTIATLKKQLP
ncbi:MAG: tetratricopeptide repeat protein [Archangium sp.]